VLLLTFFICTEKNAAAAVDAVAKAGFTAVSADPPVVANIVTVEVAADASVVAAAAAATTILASAVYSVTTTVPALTVLVVTRTVQV